MGLLFLLNIKHISRLYVVHYNTINKLHTIIQLLYNRLVLFLNFINLFV